MTSNGSSGGERLVGRFTESALLKKAKEVVAEKSKESEMFDEEAEKAMPRFKKSGKYRGGLIALEPIYIVSLMYHVSIISCILHYSTTKELGLGRVLGRGGFCVVNEIQKFNLEPNSPLDLKNDNDDIVDEEEDEFGELRYDGGVLVQDRKFMARRCLRKGTHARYAIKILSDECLNDPERFVGGVIDLAVESRFLSVIRHPNIIKMRGVADCNPYDRGFFVVLDRLYSTLTMKIMEWKKVVGKTKGIGKIMDMKGKKKRKVWVDRLIVVYDLSTALEYLHSQK